MKSEKGSAWSVPTHGIQRATVNNAKHHYDMVRNIVNPNLECLITNPYCRPDDYGIPITAQTMMTRRFETSSCHGMKSSGTQTLMGKGLPVLLAWPSPSRFHGDKWSVNN